MIIDDQGKNIVSTLKWDRWNFDFNSHYCDQNLIFVLDRSTGKFVTSNILIELAETINEKYLKIDKRFDIKAFFTDWFVTKKKGNGFVIGSNNDFNKLPSNKKDLIPFIQTSHGVFIRKNVRFFTAVEPVRGTGTITGNCKRFSIHNIPSS